MRCKCNEHEVSNNPHYPEYCSECIKWIKAMLREMGVEVEDEDRE